ncbi:MULTISPECIES: hypothetical protein [Microbacterium]|uniref:hypothetical protein n=1 Tax=Microbacterium TaxID=33882 RepID=UPI001F464864|nr:MULTISPECIES: hypothetical protein [Microbacterium]
MDMLRITGARTNNLRDVSVVVPKKLLTVFTGVSGSGKSSLVLDTIAAEAQRLVNDSYSTFIRSRLPQLPTPDVQAMDGLTFTVLIDQRRFTGNARSTVAPRPIWPRSCASSSPVSASRRPATPPRTRSTTPPACARPAKGSARCTTSTSMN